MTEQQTKSGQIFKLGGGGGGGLTEYVVGTEAPNILSKIYLQKDDILMDINHLPFLCLISYLLGFL